VSATRHVGFELSSGRAAGIPVVLIGAFLTAVCVFIGLLGLSPLPPMTFLGRPKVHVGPIILLVASLIAYVLLVSALAVVRELAVALDEKRREAEHAARTDPATGLPNRFACRCLLADAIEAAPETSVGVLMVNLDRLKDVNDAHGISAGDRVIAEMIVRLRDAVADAPDAVLGRFGGDEFIVLAPGLSGDRAMEIAEGIVAAARRPLALPNGVLLHLGASVGVATALADLDADEVIGRADRALHRAKASGRGVAVPYSAVMDEETQRLSILRARLRAAMEQGGFEVHYQPIVSLNDGRVVAVEALLRWRDAVLGSVSPAVFVPIAESIGLMDEIGAFVLARACLDWRDAEAVVVSVNVSPVQMRSGALPRRMREVLAATGMPATRIDVELTESAVMADEAAALEQMRALRALGVRLSLDDFGTGYSSLAHLRRFPFDKLKIDKAFVDDIERSDEARTVLAAIVALGRGLGMHVTAEGVEREAQALLLRAAGCHSMQGWLVGKPMAREKTAAFVEGLGVGEARAA
jgi:diguanylate cyclase (GGDEF)-like protein